MKRRLVLISVLLLVPVLVNWAILFLSSDVPLNIIASRRFSSVMSATFRGQAVLLAIWAGLARGPLPWRLSGMIGGIALCEIPLCLIVSIETFSTEIAMFTVLGSVRVVHIVAVLLVARCCGVGLELHSDAGSLESSSPLGPRYQYSLRYLLWWTTGLAVLLSMIQCFALYAEDSGYIHKVFVSFWRLDSPGLISIGLIALAAFWAALGSRWLVLRVILLVSAVAAASLVKIWPIDEASLVALPSCYFTKWLSRVTFHFLPFGAWVTGSLLVFRIIGYRIAWRRPMWWVAGAKRSGAPEIHDS